MKILYASQYFPPEMGAPAARVSELARHWADSGHKVTVLTGFPNHPTGVVPPEYKAKLRKIVCRERKDGIDVVRTWLMPLPNRKPLERILNYTSFFVSSCLTGTFLRQADVVIGTSPQLLVGLTGWWLGRIKRIPFVLEIRDLWPESLTASGVGGSESLMSRSLRALSGFLYRRSDHIVVVSPAFVEELVNKWNVPREKISVVANGVETELFNSNGAPESYKDKLGLKDKFVVSYIGTLGQAHGLSTLLQSAAQLQFSHPEILFLFVGAGAEKENLQAQAQSQSLRNVQFLSEKPRQEIPSIIKASDACVVHLKKADVFKTVIPTKMLEFMSCGRPVILGVEGQARQIVEEAEAGICIEPENAPALSQAVTQVYRNASLRRRLGDNGHNYISKRFSRAHMAHLYTEILAKVVSNYGNVEDPVPSVAEKSM